MSSAVLDVAWLRVLLISLDSTQVYPAHHMRVPEASLLPLNAGSRMAVVRPSARFCVVLALVTACLIELSRKWICSFGVRAALRSQPAEEALELPLELSLSLYDSWVRLADPRAVGPRQCALWSEVKSSAATATSHTSSFSGMKGSVSRILATARAATIHG